MVKMEPYVKKWYDFLGEGKLMGMKCNQCGSYEFPPVPVCNKCSSTSLTWTEMSGEGKLINFGIVSNPDPIFESFGPYVFGRVLLKEGPSYASMILGVELKNAAQLYDKLPIPVKAETQDRGDYKFVIFRIKYNDV